MAWTCLHLLLSWEGHIVYDGGENMGKRAPLCVGPWAGLAAAPGERSLGSHSGAGNQNSDFPSQFSSLSGPQPTTFLGAWVPLPDPELPSPSTRPTGVGRSLPRMTHSQQWKEEPISQQCRGWGWRWEWSSGPLCGADKVRKLRLEWEEAQCGALSHGWGLRALPSQASVTGACMWNGMTAVTLTGQWTLAAPGYRGHPVCQGWAMGAQSFSW